MENQNPKEVDNNTAKKAVGIALAVIATVLVLTWAVAIFFEIALVKALAGVILVLFVVIIALFMAGIT